MAKLALFVIALLPAEVAAWAEEAMPTNGGVAISNGTVSAAPIAQEAEAAFRAARESYRAIAAGGPTAVHGDIDESISPTTQMIPGGRADKDLELERINLMVDVENATLRAVVADVVKQAAQHTGPWTVKWRLNNDNANLMDERVNLTAEAPLGEFFALLAEKVKNLTGTQLFVTVFSGTRVILITDTYY